MIHYSPVSSWFEKDVTWKGPVCVPSFSWETGETQISQCKKQRCLNNNGLLKIRGKGAGAKATDHWNRACRRHYTFTVDFYWCSQNVLLFSELKQINSCVRYYCIQYFLYQHPSHWDKSDLAVKLLRFLSTVMCERTITDCPCTVVAWI